MNVKVEVQAKVMDGPIDQAIARRASRQNRNITRHQLLALGLSSSGIRHRVRAGRLHRTFSTVYTVGTPALTPIERASAAVLACGRKAVLSHASAMCLWGIWRRWSLPFVVTLMSGDRRPVGIELHRSRTLHPRDICTHLGIRVTSPARTILDMAPRLNDEALARAVNDALHTKLFTTGQLAELLERNPNHAGTRRLRYFATTTDGPTRAQWERAFPAFCRRYGLPKPDLTAPVAGHVVDAYWPAEKVIVELDGWDFHNTRIDFETDRERDADTAAAGNLTVRITWRRIHDRAEREASRLHAILAVRRQDAA